MKVHADRVQAEGKGANLSRRLLNWYDREGRDLPWRVKGGAPIDPYHVWLSEIMLQQTTVATVGPYFSAFLKHWPTMFDLAAASLDDILHAWQGLGYYARARNLHKCAIEIAGHHKGRFPEDEAGLRALPGIGPYTAAAIAAIAFQRPTTVMDGNVERVMSRLHMVKEELPAGKPVLFAHAEALTPKRRAGDYAQALMDLGATVCTPTGPQCDKCPWSGSCEAKAHGTQEAYPRRAAKAERPIRRGTVFWVEDGEGSILIRRREEKGLLGGLMEVPSSAWLSGTPKSKDLFAEAPIHIKPVNWIEVEGVVKHTFTHFHLLLNVRLSRLKEVRPRLHSGAMWCAPDRFADHAFPTVMKKVIRHVAQATGS